MSLPMLPVASVCKVYFCWRLWRNFTHDDHTQWACRCCQLLQFVKSTSAEGCEETSHMEAICAVPADVAICFNLLNSLLLLKAVKKLHTRRPHTLSLPMLQVASVCYAQTHSHKNTFKIQCSWSGSVCLQLLPCKTNTFFCNIFILSSSRESWEKSVL